MSACSSVKNDKTDYYGNEYKWDNDETIPLRYIHILWDMIKRAANADSEVLKTLTLKNHKVLIVGPGCSQIEQMLFDRSAQRLRPYRYISSPQAYEAMMLGCKVYACDSVPFVVEVLKKNPIQHFGISYSDIMQVDMTFSPGSEGEDVTVRNRVLNNLITKLAKGPRVYPALSECVLWDPSNPSASAPDSFNDFDSIIMTHSAATFPYQKKRENAIVAYRNLYKLLAPCGRLYVDEWTHKIVFSSPAIDPETFLSDEFSAPLLSIVPRVIIAADTAFRNSHVDPKFTKDNLHTAMSGEVRVSLDGKGSDCPVYNGVSFPAVTITKVPLGLLRGLDLEQSPVDVFAVRTFNAPKNEEYWHNIAKTKKAASFYVPRPALTNVETQLGNASFSKVTYTEGWNPLHVAVLAKNKEAVKYFLGKGVRSDVKDLFGNTAQEYAHVICPELLSLLKH